MNFYQFAAKNLLRSRTRTVLTAVSIIITTAVLFLGFSLDKGFKVAVQENLVDGIGAHLFVSRGGCPMDAASIIAQGGISPMYVPEETLEKIKNIEGIHQTMAFQVFAITTPDGSRTDIFNGVTEEIQDMRPKWKYKQGGWFKDKDSIILGADIALVEKRAVGDKIYFEHFNREFIVAGILDYSFSQDDGMFFLPLKTAQKLINREGKLSAISVRLKNINNIDDIKAEITGRLPDDYMVLTPDSIGEEIMKFFNSTRAVMYMALFFIIAVTTTGIANTIMAMIFERRKEIAYLKCVGAGNSDVYRLVLFETLIVCAIGVAAGLLLAAAFSGVFESFAEKTILPGYVSEKVDIIKLELWSAALSASIVLFTVFLAASYPFVKALKITPMEAMRND